MHAGYLGPFIFNPCSEQKSKWAICFNRNRAIFGGNKMYLIIYSFIYLPFELSLLKWHPWKCERQYINEKKTTENSFRLEVGDISSWKFERTSCSTGSGDWNKCACITMTKNRGNQHTNIPLLSEVWPNCQHVFNNIFFFFAFYLPGLGL